MQVPFDPKTLRVFANEGSRAGMSRPGILKYVGLVFFSGGVLFVFNARKTRTGFADWLLVSRRITRNAAILRFPFPAVCWRTAFMRSLGSAKPVNRLYRLLSSKPPEGKIHHVAREPYAESLQAPDELQKSLRNRLFSRLG
jgi:hypothetical protein